MNITPAWAQLLTPLLLTDLQYGLCCKSQSILLAASVQFPRAKAHLRHSPPPASPAQSALRAQGWWNLTLHSYLNGSSSLWTPLLTQAYLYLWPYHPLNWRSLRELHWVFRCVNLCGDTGGKDHLKFLVNLNTNFIFSSIMNSQHITASNLKVLFMLTI